MASTLSDPTILIRAKLGEIRRHLAHVRLACVTCHNDTHPNMAERLRLRLTGIDDLDRREAALERRLALYAEKIMIPPLDTWRQLCKELTALSAAVQWLRTVELPAYLAVTPDDDYVSHLLSILHREIGLVGVNPAASLHQARWFAVHPTPPRYPLYFVPASIAVAPGELPLIFHEIGHVLFEFWNPTFGDRLEAAVVKAIATQRKRIGAFADPAMRADSSAALQEWDNRAFEEMEEIACDVVGTLLGGPAYVVALAIGLLADNTRPFEPQTERYPPLDCRMRLGGLVLRRRGLDDDALRIVEAGWSRTRDLYTANRPRWYATLYDDDYLMAIATVVERSLLDRGLRLYEPGCGGLRALLVAGTTALFGQERAYQEWRDAFVTRARDDYASSSHASSSSSSSSSSISSA